jgi:hypothetical protein
MRAAIMRLLMLAFIIGGIGMYAPLARAQCAGFTDVPNGGNCTSITWIKNRQITLGCTPATQFCPSQPVSRLAMAAFMNRLGNVLTPLILDEEETGNSLDITTGSFLVCQTDVVPAVNYPRTIIAQASVSFALAGLQNVSYGVATSINGAAFGFDFPLVAMNGPGLHNLHYLGTQQPVAAGSTYRFAVRVARSGSLPAALGAWGCHLQVTIVNAFGSL